MRNDRKRNTRINCKRSEKSNRESTTKRHTKIIRKNSYAYDVPRDFEGIKEYLKDFLGEGIVYWVDGEPIAKIKRSDFGYPWNAEVRRELSIKLVKSVTEGEK